MDRTGAAGVVGRRHAQRPWWETWRAGFARGMPLWELLLVAAALLAFVVGLVCVPLAFALYPALRPLSLSLVPLAIAVVWFVEQRMKARLARWLRTSQSPSRELNSSR